MLGSIAGKPANQRDRRYQNTATEAGYRLRRYTMAHLLADLTQITGVLYVSTIAVVALIAALAPTPRKRTDARATLALLLQWLRKDRR